MNLYKFIRHEQFLIVFISANMFIGNIHIFSGVLALFCFFKLYTLLVLCSALQAYPENAIGVLSHGSAILAADEELLRDATLNGAVREGAAARLIPKSLMDQGQ